jgi:integral membrane protein
MRLNRSFLRSLRTLGLIEGTSTLLLFGIAMPLKYFGGMPLAVTIMGTIHGILFVALVAMFALGITRVPLPPGLAAKGVAAAIVPFGPFLIDRRLRRLD